MYIVIAGGGKVAEYLATTMLNKGHDVAVIEIDEATARELAVKLPRRALVICGDGCDSIYQNDAGITHADVFVATTGNDDDNLVSCEIARIVYRVPRTIARINNPRNERIFRKVGIESVSATTTISRLIEEEAFTGDIKVMSSLHKGDLTLCEVDLERLGRFEGGMRVSDIEMPDDALLIAVSRAGSDEVETMGSDTTVYGGDTVFALTKKSSEKAVRAALRH